MTNTEGSKEKEIKYALTTALCDIDVYSKFRNIAAREVGHAAVGGLISEFHVHNLQAAGARGHVWVTAQHNEAV